MIPKLSQNTPLRLFSSRLTSVSSWIVRPIVTLTVSENCKVNSNERNRIWRRKCLPFLQVSDFYCNSRIVPWPDQLPNFRSFHFQEIERRGRGIGGAFPKLRVTGSEWKLKDILNNYPIKDLVLLQFNEYLTSLFCTVNYWSLTYYFTCYLH